MLTHSSIKMVVDQHSWDRSVADMSLTDLLGMMKLLKHRNSRYNCTAEDLFQDRLRNPPNWISHRIWFRRLELNNLAESLNKIFYDESRQIANIFMTAIYKLQMSTYQTTEFGIWTTCLWSVHYRNIFNWPELRKLSTAWFMAEFSRLFLEQSGSWW